MTGVEVNKALNESREKHHNRVQVLQTLIHDSLQAHPTRWKKQPPHCKVQ